MDNYQTPFGVLLQVAAAITSFYLAWQFGTPPANLALVSTFAVMGVTWCVLLVQDIFGMLEG
jgi:hypothetical protein